MDEEKLLIKLSVVDDMSDKLSYAADIGDSMANRFEMAGQQAGSAFDSIGIATSSAADAIESASDAIGNVTDSITSTMQGASDSTDNWTAAVENYDKSALEAVYSTQELVEMGLKSADALLEQGDMAQTCDKAMNELINGMDSATEAQSELSDLIDNANSLFEENANAESMSAEANEELQRAARQAADALQELENMMNSSRSAMEDFDSVMTSEALDVNDLATATDNASKASDMLAAAQEKANAAAEELSKATQDAAKSMQDMGDTSEEGGKKSSDALSAIAETAVAVAIADKVKDITASVYEMTEAFSEAEKVVVNATGATGDALKSLDSSMMSAFSSHHEDLSNTAGAIGEINTRMGLTGKTLTDMTGNFLDFADITGSDVVGSVQNVTKVMNKWNVEQSETVSVLDKLSYEAQVSGASVDSLESSLINGASSFQAMDLSLDTTISLLGALELQGINSSSVIMALRTATKKFSDEGLNSGEALRNTIDQIATMKDKAEATSLAIETFGSRAGIEMANAIRNGAITVEMLNSDLSVAEGTLKKTAEAGETLSEKWDKASNKMTTAVTNTLQPTIDSISSKLADLFGGIGDFLGEHPFIIKILGGLAAGLGVVTVALTGYTVAVNFAIPAIEKFTAALSANPIGAVITAAVTAAAVISTLAVAFSDGADSVADYDGTLEECSREIENTRIAHEKAIEMYGEESDAAKSLGDQLDTLNAQYEKGGGILEDYAQRASEGFKKFSDFETEYHDRINSISGDQTAALVMVAQLETLKDKADKTNFDLDMMSKYADYLNDTFECNIKVNYNTGDLTGFDPKILTDGIIKKTQEAMYQAEVDAVTNSDAAAGYIDALNRLPQTIKNQEAQQARMDKVGDTAASTAASGNIISWIFGGWSAASVASDLSTANKAVEETEAVINGFENRVKTAFSNIGLPAEEAERYIESLKTTAENSKGIWSKMLDGITGATHPVSEFRTELDAFSDRYQTFIRDGKLSTEELVSLVETAPEEVQGALSTFTSEILELQTAYEDVYNSAYESYQGQFGLFEQASTETETYLNSTVENAQAALDTQLSYWTSYSENMDYITSYAYDKMNVSKEDWNSFVQYLGSGTEEAAGLLNNVQELLSKGDYEAVEKLVNTQGKLKEIHGDTADDLAQFETEYDTKMSKLVEDTTNAIKDMEIPSEAKLAATKTMDAYLQSLHLGGQRAISEAQSIAQRIASALNVDAKVNVSASGSSTNQPVQMNAAGTTYSDDVFIAGENGPELIIGKQGSTVFPTSETDRIVEAVAGLESVHTLSRKYDRISDYSMNTNSPDDIADRLESVFIPVIGKTVEIAEGIAQSVISARSEGTTVVLPEHRNETQHEDNSGSSEKRIVIDINGGGSIEVSGGADKETVLEVLQENLKPVLMNIISSEIYEEGDDSYDY